MYAPDWRFPRHLASVTALCALAPAVLAVHIPPALDVAALWTPLPGAGYLNFVEPGPGPIGFSGTEEYTGWLDTPGAAGLGGATPDLTAPLGGPMPSFAFDNGITHGDRVDFDMVVEHRTQEVTDPSPPIEELHAPVTGFMTWEIAPSAPSAHVDPATGAPHAHVAPPIVALCPDLSSFVCLPDYVGPTFKIVDVFSLVADPLDAAGVPADVLGLVADSGEASARDAALDYMLDFCSVITGACAPGVPVRVFAPGWTVASAADDYVTRWKSPFPATHVLIDPVSPAMTPAGIPTHGDQIVQIDAIVAVAEPGTLALCALALMAIGWSGNRARRSPR
jgi:hypothetical protein